MKSRLVEIFFIALGITIGIILSLQIRANPINIGQSPVEEQAIKKNLLETFSSEQETLKKKALEIEKKREEAQQIIERRSSRQTMQVLNQLRELTDLNEFDGEGIRITLKDSPAVYRIDFSTINDNFVQATDLRDLVNALFLKDAEAISINGKRISPLTPIQSIFDSMLIGNVQIGSPFVIEAAGNPDALKEAVNGFKKRALQVFIDAPVSLKIPAYEHVFSPEFLSFRPPQGGGNL